MPSSSRDDTSLWGWRQFLPEPVNHLQECLAICWGRRSRNRLARRSRAASSSDELLEAGRRKEAKETIVPIARVRERVRDERRRMQEVTRAQCRDLTVDANLQLAFEHEQRLVLTAMYMVRRHVAWWLHRLDHRICAPRIVGGHLKGQSSPVKHVALSVLVRDRKRTHRAQYSREESQMLIPN